MSFVLFIVACKAKMEVFRAKKDHQFNRKILNFSFPTCDSQFNIPEFLISNFQFPKTNFQTNKSQNFQFPNKFSRYAGQFAIHNSIYPNFLFLISNFQKPISKQVLSLRRTICDSQFNIPEFLISNFQFPI